MSETPDEAGAAAADEPSVTERLADFMLANWQGDDFTHGVGAADAAREQLRELAELVLRDFFRVDVDATTIYAMPGVDRETLKPFGMVHWGPMAGRLDPDALRAIGGAFIEIAEAADLDSIMVRWLLRGPNATKEGAVKILAAFREFRTELQAAEL